MQIVLTLTIPWGVSGHKTWFGSSSMTCRHEPHKHCIPFRSVHWGDLLTTILLVLISPTEEHVIVGATKVDVYKLHLEVNVIYEIYNGNFIRSHCTKGGTQLSSWETKGEPKFFEIQKKKPNGSNYCLILNWYYYAHSNKCLNIFHPKSYQYKIILISRILISWYFQEFKIKWTHKIITLAQKRCL